MSTREKKPVQKYGNPKLYCIYVNYINGNVPNNYNEAINSDECEEWKNAMDCEMNSLIKNEIWDVIDYPKDKKVLGVRWVFTKKNNKKYKARLVVKGYQQSESIENVYSPVTKMSTLKILFSY